MYTAKVRLDHLKKWAEYRVAYYNEKHKEEEKHRQKLRDEYRSKPWYIRFFATDYDSIDFCFDWGWYKQWAKDAKRTLEKIDDLIQYYYPPDSIIDYHFSKESEYKDFFNTCAALGLKLN